MDRIAEEVVTAVERRDWPLLETLLHPYLHWTDANGRKLRGRANVLARLAAEPNAVPPSSIELRDGQVDRWTSQAPPTAP